MKIRCCEINASTKTAVQKKGTNVFCTKNVQQRISAVEKRNIVCSTNKKGSVTNDDIFRVILFHL